MLQFLALFAPCSVQFFLFCLLPQNASIKLTQQKNLQQKIGCIFCALQHPGATSWRKRFFDSEQRSMEDWGPTPCAVIRSAFFCSFIICASSFSSSALLFLLLVSNQFSPSVFFPLRLSRYARRVCLIWQVKNVFTSVLLPTDYLYDCFSLSRRWELVRDRACGAPGSKMKPWTWTLKQAVSGLVYFVLIFLSNLNLTENLSL